jgi:hypothetical protein
MLTNGLAVLRRRRNWGPVDYVASGKFGSLFGLMKHAARAPVTRALLTSLLATRPSVAPDHSVEVSAPQLSDLKIAAADIGN